jgi:hypothetical protein
LGCSPCNYRLTPHCNGPGPVTKSINTTPHPWLGAWIQFPTWYQPRFRVFFFSCSRRSRWELSSPAAATPLGALLPCSRHPYSRRPPASRRPISLLTAPSHPLAAAARLATLPGGAESGPDAASRLTARPRPSLPAPAARTRLQAERPVRPRRVLVHTRSRPTPIAQRTARCPAPAAAHGPSVSGPRPDSGHHRPLTARSSAPHPGCSSFLPPLPWTTPPLPPPAPSSPLRSAASSLMAGPPTSPASGRSPSFHR